VSGSAGRISLYLTLGIAAVDMLMCAFISTVVLFIMFLMPGKEPSGGGTGSENQMVFQWEFTSRKSVVRIDFNRDGSSEDIYVWSNDPELWPSPDLCAELSNSMDRSACRLIISDDGIGGMLIIQDPKSDKWDVTVAYADSADSSNGSALDDLDFSMTAIGVGSLQILFSQLPKDGSSVSLRETALEEGYSEDAIDTALTIK
jgi:hypothetical protein